MARALALLLLLSAFGCEVQSEAAAADDARPPSSDAEVPAPDVRVGEESPVEGDAAAEPPVVEPDAGHPVDPDEGTAPPPPEEDPCVPDREVWEADIRPLVTARCGHCHDEPPQYGAPFTLLDYDALVDGAPGERRVDRMAFKLAEGTMPPPGQTQPSTPEKLAILDWATCGDTSDLPPVNPGGFDSSRPPLAADEDPPADSEFFELRASDFRVRERDDDYQCFTFVAPTMEERFIRRIDAIIDDARVVHHLVLLRGPAGTRPGQQFPCFDISDSLYAWAPGMGALAFAEGGMRMQPGAAYILQIHYNNRARVDGSDSSGVRIYHGETVGPEVAMVVLGPTAFSIPARGRGEATGHCTFPRDTHVIGSWPHMHEVGDAFEATVHHADGRETDLVTLDGWDFETQLVYDTPVDISAGDRVTTTCRWANLNDRPVGFGPDTSDEMCFNFVYHTPPLPWSICDQAAPEDEGGPYDGGECLGDIGDLEVPFFRGRILEGLPPELRGDARPDGVWTMADGSLYIPTFDTPIGPIDAENSVIRGRGVFTVGPDRVALDAQIEIQISIGGRIIDQPYEISAAGSVVEAAGGVMRLNVDCGDGGIDTVRYDVVEGRLRALVEVDVAGFTLRVLFTLRPGG